MYRLTLGALLILDLGLAAMLIADWPGQLEFPQGILDCCQSGASEEPYCCKDCCWIISDCSWDEDCG